MHGFRYHPSSKGEKKKILVLIGQYWTEVLDDNPLFNHTLKENKISHRQSKSSPYSGRNQRLNLMYLTGQALMVWKRKKSERGYYGIQCTLFINHSSILSSKLIVDGQKLAGEQWDDVRFFIHLNPKEDFKNLANSFVKAGWKMVGLTKDKRSHIYEIEVPPK